MNGRPLRSWGSLSFHRRDLSKNPLRLPSQHHQGTCTRCQNKKLAGLYFALPYQERFLTRKLIYQFKYHPYIKDLAKNLASLLAEHCIITGKNIHQIWENSILIPIPMEIKKLKKRGYNQSEELAKELGHLINVPTTSQVLIKVKKTLPQMQLSAKERSENLKNAFLVKNHQEIQGKKIWLVDDVYTTGSTMEECAKTLKQAGAKQVWGIAIAREA
jgi:ComF family protein